MNYAYTLGILEARVALRADILDQHIKHAAATAQQASPSEELDQIQDTLDTLREEIMNLKADIQYAKQHGNMEMTTHHELHHNAIRQHDR